MSILNIFNQVEISHYIYLSTVLFAIGLFGAVQTQCHHFVDVY